MTFKAIIAGVIIALIVEAVIWTVRWYMVTRGSTERRT